MSTVKGKSAKLNKYYKCFHCLSTKCSCNLTALIRAMCCTDVGRRSSQRNRRHCSAPEGVAVEMLQRSRSSCTPNVAVVAAADHPIAVATGGRIVMNWN